MTDGERETIVDQRFSYQEGAIGGRQQQHRKRLTRKRDLENKRPSEEETEGSEVGVIQGGGRSSDVVTSQLPSINLKLLYSYF